MRPSFLSLPILCFLILLCPLSRAESVDDLEQWSIITLGVRPSEKVRLYLEAQPRWVDNISRIERLILRPAVGYQVNEHLSVWQGYAWTPTFHSLNLRNQEFTGEFQSENRLFQQALLENQWKKLKIVNRTRLEERFIEGAGKTSIRLRHMLRFTHPLPRSERWSLVTYDEFFLNLNDTPTGPQGGFDQNRLFWGVNRQLSENATIEVGYLNNPTNVFRSSVNRTRHAIVLTLNLKI